MVKYKLGIKTAGDKDWVHNALRFDTREEAQRYGDNLAGRWFAVTAWEVHEEEVSA